MSQAEVERLTGGELLERHRRTRLEREVALDERRAWCPVSDCQTICHVCPQAGDTTHTPLPSPVNRNSIFNISPYSTFLLNRNNENLLFAFVNKVDHREAKKNEYRFKMPSFRDFLCSILVGCSLQTYPFKVSKDCSTCCE